MCKASPFMDGGLLRLGLPCSLLRPEDGSEPRDLIRPLTVRGAPPEPSTEVDRLGSSARKEHADISRGLRVKQTRCEALAS